MHGNFLCGCAPGEKTRYSGNTMANPLPGGDPIYTDKRRDSEGFEVCPEHGERLYGWKSSDPNHPHYISNGSGMPPTFVAPGVKTLKIRESEFPDTRDNRDPIEMAEARALEKTVSGNGDYEIGSEHYEIKPKTSWTDISDLE